MADHTLFCNRCGVATPKFSNYCWHCGQTLLRQAKKHGRRLIVLLAIFLLAAVVFYTLYTPSSVSVAAKEHLLALRGGRLIEAYYGLSSATLQKRYTFEQFQDLVSEKPPLTEFAELFFTEEEVKKNVGSAIGELLLSDGSLVPIEMKLIREGGEWKMLAWSVATPSSLKPAADPKTAWDPITVQINDIRTFRYNEAYHNVLNDEFKSQVPFDEFSTFLKANGDLFHYPYSISHRGRSEDGVETYLVTFHTELGAVPLQYEIVREKNQWLIWSLKFEAADFEHRLSKPLMKMLQTIRSKEYHNAYRLAAPRFQTATKEESFTAFLNSQPLLTRFTSYQIMQAFTDQEIAKAQVELFFGQESDVYEFSFITEEEGPLRLRGISKKSRSTADHKTE